MTDQAERVSLEDWPGGPLSFVIRGPAGAVQLYPAGQVTLHFHRPRPGPGDPSHCPLLPGGQCWEEINQPPLLAAELAAAGKDHVDEVAWQRLGELYERMAREEGRNGG